VIVKPFSASITFTLTGTSLSIKLLKYPLQYDVVKYFCLVPHGTKT